MSDATIFYILAGILAGLAVIVSFIGIKVEGFPGKAMPVVILVFIALIGGATTYSVLNGKHEEEVRAAELDEANEAAEEVQQDEGPPEPGEAAPSGSEGEKTVSGPGGTLQLKASETELAFDTKSLQSAPGEVTIDFDNPAQIPHNVAIEENGKVVAESETIAAGETSVTQPLASGEYTFLCTVPGHAEAGMEGTLTVE